MDIRKTLDNAARSVKKNIKTILMDIGVAAVSVSYILYELLTLETTKLNPLVLLAQAAVGIMAGITIKTGLGENGFTRGYKSDTWITIKNKYNTRADMALPYIDKVDEFQEKQNNERLAKIRKTFLSRNRIRYDDFFDSNGDFIERDIISPKEKKKLGKVPENAICLDNKQKRALYKSVRIKVYTRELFTEYETELNTYERKEITDKEQKAKAFSKNLIGAVAIALIGVYFSPIWAWSLSRFLWALFQVALWIAFGFLQLYDNYYFITNDRANNLEKKIQDLSKFIISVVGKEDFATMIKDKQAEEIIELTPEQAKDLIK